MAWERYLAVLQKIQAAGAWRPECPSMWVCWHGRYYHKIETFLLIFFLKRCGLSEQRNTYLYFLALNRAVNLELLTWPQLVWKKKKNYGKKMVTCTNIDFVLRISLNNVDKTVLNLWHVQRRWSCDRIGPWWHPSICGKLLTCRTSVMSVNGKFSFPSCDLHLLSLFLRQVHAVAARPHRCHQSFCGTSPQSLDVH